MTNVHLENRKISRQFYLIIWIEYALIYMTKNCFSAAMAGIVYEGVLTKSQTGLINAVFFLFYGPLQIVGGLFADRYNPEKLIKIGLICSATLNFLLFAFHDFLSMLILWGLNGVAQFAIWPAIVKIITSQLTSQEQKDGAFYITFASVGGMLLSYLTAAFITQWEYNFLVSGLILLLLAVLWVAECHKVDPYMVQDLCLPRENVQPSADGRSAGKLFWRSGFWFIVAYFFFRTLVDQAIKAFSPTMLMEIYPGVTPSVGNLLNLLIIGTTLIGAFMIRKLYPKYVRSEVTAMLLLSLMALPFSVVLLFAGKISLIVTVIGLCGVLCLLNCGTVLVNCANTHFAPFGKSATAAGIANAVASIAFIFVNYGVALLAEWFHWTVVLAALLGFVILSAICVAVAIPLWKRFTKQGK